MWTCSRKRMTLLTGISLIVQVKLAAGRLYLDVQLPRMISPSLYFARILCICGGPPGTSVDRRGENRKERKGWKLFKWLHSGCFFFIFVQFAVDNSTLSNTFFTLHGELCHSIICERTHNTAWKRIGWKKKFLLLRHHRHTEKSQKLLRGAHTRHSYSDFFMCKNSFSLAFSTSISPSKEHGSLHRRNFSDSNGSAGSQSNKCNVMQLFNWIKNTKLNAWVDIEPNTVRDEKKVHAFQLTNYLQVTADVNRLKRWKVGWNFACIFSSGRWRCVLQHQMGLIWPRLLLFVESVF